MKFSFHPIQQIACGEHRGGGDDSDFEPSMLPFVIMDGLAIEEIAHLIRDDEFDIYRSGMGTYAHDKLDRLRYALVHRFPDCGTDEVTGKFVFGAESVHRSWALVRNVAACLRLIRPMTEYLHLFHGEIDDDGKFTRIALDTPVDYVINPFNQRQFGFRTQDAHDLKFYAPRFVETVSQDFWKFRMAVQLHESGCFQNDDWRAKFFLWTTAVEALFTSQSPDGENSGSKVACERIKFFLGDQTPIYPPGELMSLYPNPGLTVTDVVGEIYCLRNHIAHGDRVPNHYLTSRGRGDLLGGTIVKHEVLLEAISFIIRHSLLKILREDIASSFADTPSSEAYFGAHRLTKTALKRIPRFPCPP